MNTIGETLRRERIRQGLDFQALSDSTKISTRMLQAMEAGDLSKLPGGVFTRSFYKQYAAALGLDPAYVEAELRELQGDPPVPVAPPESNFVPFNPLQAKSNSLTSAGIWVVLALLGCGGVYYFTKNYQPSAKPRPGESADVVPAPAPSKTAPPASASASEPAPQPTEKIGSGSLQVVLNASEKSWVSVSVDGKLLFSGILKPNERREINAEEKVKVVTGNAGGIDVSLNGKTIEALGPRGQVRTVELTRAGAQVVSRTPKSGPLL